MKYILTESQLLRLIKEQDAWLERNRRAASGPQKCGKDAKWCADDQGGGREERIRNERLPSEKQQKKYNENEYWNAQLLRDVSKNPDFFERANMIKGQVEIMPGKFTTDDKVKIIFNLTNKLNKDAMWWFPGLVKKTLKIQPTDKLTDQNVIDFVKMKGGFDQFKNYYINDVF